MQKPVETPPPPPPPPTPPAWARRIKFARERAGLAQWELGKKINRSQQTVHGYETGGREPDVSMYREIAEACSIDPVWLAFGEDRPNPNPSLDPVSRPAPGPGPGGNPSGDQTIAGVIAEAEKQSRHFAWAFQEAAKFLAEEGIDADFPYTMSYTQKLLRTAEREADDTRVKQTILRTIEHDRAELREHLKHVRNQIL